MVSESTRGPAPGLSKADEAALIKRAQAGDLESFEVLLSRHEGRVYAVALRLLRDPDEAEEVAQEVLVACFRHLKRFRGESTLATWLYRTTVNRVKNRWRYHQRRRRASHQSLDTGGRDADGRPEPMELPDAAPGPRAQAQAHQLYDRLEAAIDQLPEEFREAVVLRFFEDLSYEEIAEVLEVSLGTVKSRINRGRRRLRESMGDILED